MCCRGCNSSKGVQPLVTWLASSYCQKKGITPKAVAPVVRRYLRSLETAARHRLTNRSSQPLFGVARRYRS
jgi:hypothetical protein